MSQTDIKSEAAAVDQIDPKPINRRGISRKNETPGLANHTIDVSTGMSPEEGLGETPHHDAGVMQVHLGGRNKGNSMSEIILKSL